MVKKNRDAFKAYTPFQTRFETVAAVGSVFGYTRKRLLICTYMPPGMKGADGCFEKIAGLLNQARLDYEDPFVVVGGDFNEFCTSPLTIASQS